MKKTDMKLAERLSKLYGEFNKMCKSRRCEGCELEAFGKYGVCDHAWVWKKMREEEVRAKVTAAPNESPKTKEPSRPAWCEEGQWVMTPSGSVAQISVVGTLGATVQFRDCSLEFLIDDLKPVCFREYSFEEAKELLGKTMEYCDKRMEYHINNEDPSVDHASLIYRISRNNNFGEIFINSKSFYELQGSHATIDGVPIGIPEVDEEAGRKVTNED